MKRTLLLLFLAVPLFAQSKRLTFDAIYDPEKRIRIVAQNGFDWIDDRSFVWPKTHSNGAFTGWMRFDTMTGKESPLYDVAAMTHALVAAGVPSEAASAAASSDGLVFDSRKSSAIATISGDLWLLTFAKPGVVRLTNAAGEEEVPTFSPDDRSVAFTRNNELWVVDLAGHERRLTTDGGRRILNGKLDWLYQEEVYGRGNWRGYWWSPDSKRIAFLRLDETAVPDYTIVDHIPYRPALEVYPYPKPGDANPRASLHIVPVAGGAPVRVDNERYGPELLIVGVTWARDGNVVYQVQNREQSWLELVKAAPDGSSLALFRDTTKAWVDPLGSPVWLRDGGFLWQSERSGWRHLYRYRADGSLVEQVTRGEWEVREVHGVDEKNGWIYFSGTERSPIGLDVYRCRLDGSAMARVSSVEGTHTATFNPSFTRYVDKWSDIRTPDQVRVHQADGKELAVIDANRVAALEELQLPRPQFLQVKTRDGFPMEAMIIRPRAFDPTGKYPVYQFLYAGPHSQQVLNKWRGQMMLFNQLIADEGVIVWMCDNRTASGKGAVSSWPAYKNLGESELRDILDGLDWLSGQPGVDGSRVMLNGWSYGGFMVSYAMTHSERFIAGVAGGPVTDWRDYDSIYTERLMLRPEKNPEGYKRASPRFSAKNLHGRLLLMHGTTDNNVHLQNTIQMVQALQQEAKMFDLMVLPQTQHTVSALKTVAFQQKRVLEFLRRELLGLP